jgi:hypothetical protein
MNARRRWCSAFFAVSFLIGLSTDLGVAQEQAATPGTWTIQPPAPRLVLLAGRQTSLIISVADSSPRTIRLAHSTLQDEKTGALVSIRAFELCDTVKSTCSDAITVAGRTQRGVVLQVRDTFQTQGSFTGSVVLAADNRAETATIPLTLHSTTHKARWLGLGLIVLGILLSLVTVILRGFLLRADALRPALRLAADFRRLLQKVANAETATTAKFPRTRVRIAELVSELEPKQLEASNLVPSILGAGAPPDADAYKVFLDEKVAALRAIDVVLIVLNSTRLSTPAGTALSPARQKALTELDELAERVTTVQQSSEETKRIIEELDQAEGRPRSQQAPGARPPDLEQLLVQVRAVSAATWAIWAVVTVAVGWAALIATNYGFGGSSIDYVVCFLWGLGLPMSGQQLQQTTPETVRSQFNLSIPKTA